MSLIVPYSDCAACLPLVSSIGFEGKISKGLHSDPSGQYLLYAIGTNVIKADSMCGRQTFMIGHGNNVTCLDIDRCGRYAVSGQMNHMGFKAEVIIWDFCTGCKVGRFCIHSTRVNACGFSHDSRYIMTVGNLDDGNVCIYDMCAGKVICGKHTIKGRNGIPKTMDVGNTRNNFWVVGGDDYLGVWILDTKENRLGFERANLMKTKRDILVICVDAKDEFAYCGTGTGDILKVKLNLPSDACCDTVGPPRTCPALCIKIHRIPHPSEKGRNNHLYKGGVTALKILENGDLLIGTGSGVVAQGTVKTLCGRGDPQFALQEYGGQMCVRGQVTSLVVNSCQDVIVGTTANEVYYGKLGCLDSSKMISSAHHSVVNDIAFPNCFSEFFASCNFEDVRIWNSAGMRELVRINVPNMTCNAVIFSPDGKAVISGWNDSHIRTYTPQTGSPLWVIHHAHLKGVTALAITSDGRSLASGGTEGQVRIWSLCPRQMTPIGILKEHIGPVTGLRMKSNDCEVASSSIDGSIIIWDIHKFVRKALVLQDTLFLDVAWHPCECQVLGVTHNHKLGYFESFDGASIREVMASENDPVHSLDVSCDGCYIVTGGADRQVKLWGYQDGRLLRKGVVHSDEVTRVRFSPLGDYILSCCRDGSIFKWDFPKDLSC